MKKIIYELIKETRIELNQKFNLNNDFTDMCYHSCELLSSKLQEKGIKGTVVQGEVKPLWSEDLTIQHFWIELDNVILDPTSEQMDFSEHIMTRDDQNYINYIFSNNYKDF